LGHYSPGVSTTGTTMPALPEGTTIEQYIMTFVPTYAQIHQQKVKDTTKAIINTTIRNKQVREGTPLILYIQSFLNSPNDEEFSTEQPSQQSPVLEDSRNISTYSHALSVIVQTTITNKQVPEHTPLIFYIQSFLGYSKDENDENTNKNKPSTTDVHTTTVQNNNSYRTDSKKINNDVQSFALQAPVLHSTRKYIQTQWLHVSFNPTTVLMGDPTEYFEQVNKKYLHNLTNNYYYVLRDLHHEVPEKKRILPITYNTYRNSGPILQSGITQLTARSTSQKYKKRLKSHRVHKSNFYYTAQRWIQPKNYSVVLSGPNPKKSTAKVRTNYEKIWKKNLFTSNAHFYTNSCTGPVQGGTKMYTKYEKNYSKHKISPNCNNNHSTWSIRPSIWSHVVRILKYTWRQYLMWKNSKFKKKNVP
jgi:hypothetical protein